MSVQDRCLLEILARQRQRLSGQFVLVRSANAQGFTDGVVCEGLARRRVGTDRLEMVASAR